jgi:hypothetical protein
LFTYQKYSELNIPHTTNSLDGCFAYLKELVRVSRGVNQVLKKKIINPARLGITRLQPGEECAVTRGRSRYYREPPAPAGGGSADILLKKDLKFDIKPIFQTILSMIMTNVARK